MGFHFVSGGQIINGKLAFDFSQYSAAENMQMNWHCTCDYRSFVPVVVSLTMVAMTYPIMPWKHLLSFHGNLCYRS